MGEGRHGASRLASPPLVCLAARHPRHLLAAGRETPAPGPYEGGGDVRLPRVPHERVGQGASDGARPVPRRHPGQSLGSEGAQGDHQKLLGVVGLCG